MEYTFGIGEQSHSFKDISHISNSVKMESLIKNEDGRHPGNKANNPSMVDDQPID